LPSLLTSASVQQLSTILDLYPVTVLRELCLAIAGKRNFPEIVNFVHDNFSLCKQHIYIFSNESDLTETLNLDIPEVEFTHQTTEDFGVSRTFFYKHEVEIILREPLQEQKIDFVLPVRFDYLDEYVLVRFVTFERDINSLFRGRQVYLPRKSEKEKTFLDAINKTALEAKLKITSADLHKGMKTLWEKDFMDSARVKYKTEHSVDSKSMDEKKGLRKHNLPEYERIKDSKFFNSLFETIETEDYPPIVFTVDPNKGFISFGRYTERLGDSDYVVHEILKHNK
jgi:hypothetical protein